MDVDRHQIPRIVSLALVAALNGTESTEVDTRGLSEQKLQEIVRTLSGEFYFTCSDPIRLPADSHLLQLDPNQQRNTVFPVPYGNVVGIDKEGFISPIAAKKSSSHSGAIPCFGLFTKFRESVSWKSLVTPPPTFCAELSSSISAGDIWDEAESPQLDFKLAPCVDSCTSSLVEVLPKMLNSNSQVTAILGVSDPSEGKNIPAYVIGTRKSIIQTALLDALDKIFPRPIKVSLEFHPVSLPKFSATDEMRWTDVDLTDSTFSCLSKHLCGNFLLYEQVKDKHKGKINNKCLLVVTETQSDKHRKVSEKSGRKTITVDIDWCTMDTFPPDTKLISRYVGKVTVFEMESHIGTHISPSTLSLIHHGHEDKSWTFQQNLLWMYLRLHAFEHASVARSVFLHAFKDRVPSVIISANPSRYPMIFAAFQKYISTVPEFDIVIQDASDISQTRCLHNTIGSNVTLVLDADAIDSDFVRYVSNHCSSRVLMVVSMHSAQSLSAAFVDAQSLSRQFRILDFVPLELLPAACSSITHPSPEHQLIDKYQLDVTSIFAQVSQQLMDKSNLDNAVKSWLQNGAYGQNGASAPSWDIIASEVLPVSRFGKDLCREVERELFPTSPAPSPICALQVQKLCTGCGLSYLLRYVAWQMYKKEVPVFYPREDLRFSSDSDSLALSTSWKALISLHKRFLIVCDDECSQFWSDLSLCISLPELKEHRIVVLVGVESHSISLQTDLPFPLYERSCSPILDVKDLEDYTNCLKKLFPQSSDALNSALCIAQNHTCEERNCLHSERHLFVFSLAAYSGVHRRAEQWISDVWNEYKKDPILANLLQALAVLSAFNPGKSREVNEGPLYSYLGEKYGQKYGLYGFNTCISDGVFKSFFELVETGTRRTTRRINPFFARLLLQYSDQIHWSSSMREKSCLRVAHIVDRALKTLKPIDEKDRKLNSLLFVRHVRRSVKGVPKNQRELFSRPVSWIVLNCDDKILEDCLMKIFDQCPKELLLHRNVAIARAFRAKAILSSNRRFNEKAVEYSLMAVDYDPQSDLAKGDIVESCLQSARYSESQKTQLQHALLAVDNILTLPQSKDLQKKIGRLKYIIGVWGRPEDARIVMCKLEPPRTYSGQYSSLRHNFDEITPDEEKELKLQMGEFKGNTKFEKTVDGDPVEHWEHHYKSKKYEKMVRLMIPLSHEGWELYSMGYEG